MEINKKEIKKISRDFRAFASRTMRAHYNEVDSVLKKYISYIDKTNLIISYIKSIDKDDFDVKEEMRIVLSEHGNAFFDTGSSVEEEIVNTYKILKHMVGQNISITAPSIGLAYGHSGKFQDMAKGFSERIILPFANHIESYLTDIMIDMGYDEEVKYVITVHGGQVNIAKDQSAINATQYNIDINALDDLVQDIKNLLTAEIDSEVKEIIDNNVDVIQEELKKEQPRKGFVKVAIEGLQNVYPKIEGSVKLVSAITSIINFAMNVLQQA